MQETIDKIISADEHTMPAHDVTLYAGYAVDANKNNKPDYNDDAVHVRYHGNNGDYTDILCPHHHVAGGKAALSTSGKVSGKSLGDGYKRQPLTVCSAPPPIPIQATTS